MGEKMEKFIKTMCIVNPISGNGRTRKKWLVLEEFLRSKGLVFNVEWTTRPFEATELTRHSIEEGFNNIVSVGGDGTINEIVNGFYKDQIKINNDASLTIVPMGTGSDFSKILEIKGDSQKVFDLMTRGREKTCDIVKTKFISWSGELESRYFINVADVGIGSETVARVNRNSKLLGKMSFFLACFYTIFTYHNKKINLLVDEQEVYTGEACIVAIGNGSYFGGGMKIVPMAKIDDGLLDIIVLKNLSKATLIYNLASVYKGSHIKHPMVECFQGSRVKISSSEKIYLEMDGETTGTGDVDFEIIPGDMKLII